MRDVVVAHPGVQHSATLAASLHQADRLRFLATRLQVGDDPRWPWSMRAVQSRIPRRLAQGLPDSRIRRFGTAPEIVLRAASRRLGTHWSHRLEMASTRSFSRRLIRSLDDEVSVVIGTDTAAADLFATLDRRRPDILRVLDVSHPLSPTVQRLIRRDAEMWGLDPRSYDDFTAEPQTEHLVELDSAHLIVVASRFSARSLEEAGVEPHRIKVVPYGVRAPATTCVKRDDGELHVLFLGALSERKGITLMLRAMQDLHDRAAPVRLTIAGKNAGAYQLPRELPDNVAFVGSPDRAGVNELYRQADVLALPSMCEGFARTILEAMSYGCSVIATEASAAPDIAERSPEAPIVVLDPDERDTLADELLALAESDRTSHPERAREAAARHSIARYERSLIEAIARDRTR